MSEAETPARARCLRDHPGGHRLVERVEKVLVAVAGAGEASENFHIELAAEDASEHEDLIAPLREVAEPTRDHLPNSRRQSKRGRVNVLEPTFGCEKASDLAD